AGTVLFHSGYPYSVVNTGVRSAYISGATGIASATVLGDWLGGPYSTCSTPNVACLTTSQFASRANQHDWGNIPRNSFRGPGYFDTDININKTFTFHENYRLLVGANLFNLFN